MKERTVNEKEYCPIAEASKVIGDFWTILIIRELMKGCKRFNEIQETIGNITNSTLSDRLKFLTEEGVVERKQYECIPPKVEYSLTKKGQGLKSLLKELEKYGNVWMKD